MIRYWHSAIDQAGNTGVPVSFSFDIAARAIANFCASPPTGINGGQPITTDTQWGDAVATICNAAAVSAARAAIVTAGTDASNATTFALLKAAVVSLASACKDLAAENVKLTKLCAAFYDKSIKVGYDP